MLILKICIARWDLLYTDLHVYHVNAKLIYKFLLFAEIVNKVTDLTNGKRRFYLLSIFRDGLKFMGREYEQAVPTFLMKNG